LENRITQIKGEREELREAMRGQMESLSETEKVKVERLGETISRLQNDLDSRSNDL